jgi:molecular chaperone GrpE
MTEREQEEHKVVVRDRRKIDPVTGAPREPEPADAAAAGTGEQPAPPAHLLDEAEPLRAQLAERTADLQRITAEYANYRKRVDRDRVSVVEGATRTVLTGLLPVLDDIERAREHGDLTGAFKSVADQLEGVLEKLGLRPFGNAGDPFDPMLHQAVAHQTSPDVTAPTCAQVLRRGYRHGERLLRAALVAVADPEPAPPPTAEPVAPSDLPGGDLPDAGAGMRERTIADTLGGSAEPAQQGESGDSRQSGQPGAGRPETRD